MVFLSHRPLFILPSVPVLQPDNVDHLVPHLPTIVMKYQIIAVFLLLGSCVHCLSIERYDTVLMCDVNFAKVNRSTKGVCS